MPLLSAVACLLLVASIVLLIWGNQLAQFGFIVSAVLGAGALAMGLGRAAHWAEWQVWLAGLLAAGTACLLASFLFRLWMGFSTLFFMGLLVSAMVVIWQGPPLPPLRQPTAAQVTQAAHPSDQTPPGQVMREVWRDNETALHQWWGEKPEQGRHVIHLAMAIGAILGLGLGLAVPMRAAALQTAAAGAGLGLVALRLLMEQHLPEAAARLPETPRAILLVFLAVTALGFALQSRGDGEDEEAGSAPPPSKGQGRKNASKA